MSSTEGTPALHAIITPECRSTRGDEGAWAEAVARAKAEYDAILAGWRRSELQPTLHLVLGIERPFVERGPVEVRVCEHGTPVISECAECGAATAPRRNP